jgi:hypothetical protein
MRNIFKVQTDLTSFTYPIVKIIICILFYALMFFRDRFLSITTVWGEVLTTAIVCVLVIATIFCVYISIFEIFFTIGNLLKK